MNQLVNYLAVALGGALGALGRYQLGQWSSAWLGVWLPYGTLLANVIGCLLAGVAWVLLVEKGGLAPCWRQFVMVGLLGSLTTFSAFSLEAVTLLQAGRPGSACGYVAVSLFTCLSGAASGILLARWMT